jgi:uncharacterized membrane protein YukC
VKRQSGQSGTHGGGLSEEVVSLAQSNLPLAEVAMVAAEVRFAEHQWSAARTEQEKAKRLLEEILRQLQEDQEEDQEQQQQQPQPQQEPSDREKERQERAVQERNEKLKDRDRKNKKRTPVKEDW